MRVFLILLMLTLLPLQFSAAAESHSAFTSPHRTGVDFIEGAWNSCQKAFYSSAINDSLLQILCHLGFTFSRMSRKLHRVADVGVEWAGRPRDFWLLCRCLPLGIVGRTTSPQGHEPRCKRSPLKRVSSFAIATFKLGSGERFARSKLGAERSGFRFKWDACRR